MPPDPFEGPASTGTTRSASSKQVKVGKDAIRDLLRDLVLLSTDMVHNALTKEDTPERDADLWLANDAEQAGIADPISEIADRHFALAASPDVVDLIEAGFALGRYAARHLKTAWGIHRAKRKMARILPDLPEHPTNQGATE